MTAGTTPTPYADGPTPLARAVAAIRALRLAVRVRDASARAACPLHDGRADALSLRQVGTRLLIHCHAGCSSDDVVTALGLRWADLREPDTGPLRVRRRLTPKPDPLGRIVHRARQQAILESDPSYWLRRAEEFDAAGCPSCPEVASALRRRAALARWERGGPLIDPEARPW